MGQQVTSNKQLAESISCIITIHKKRYDVTQFLKEHPGGEDVILKHNGTDATDAFDSIGHSNSAKKLMANYLLKENQNLNDEKSEAAQLSVKEKGYTDYKLLMKQTLSHNVSLYRLEIPDNKSLNLPIGKHVSIAAEIDGKQIVRSYTPISLSNTCGYFDLVIKTYPQGKLSKWMAEQKEGDFITIKVGNGNFEYSRNSFKNIGMICGGTGITPMLQVIRAILADKDDTTSISVLFSNTTRDDILLKDVLEDLANKFGDRLKIFFVLSKPDDTWTQGKGHISREMIKEKFSFSKSDSKILICGPPSFVKSMIEYSQLEGFTTVFKF